MSDYSNNITTTPSPGSLLCDLHALQPICTRTSASIFDAYNNSDNNTHQRQQSSFPSVTHTTNQLITPTIPTSHLIDSGANISITNCLSFGLGGHANKS